MQIAAFGSSGAGGRALLCMADVKGLAEMTDEWIYGKLPAPDLHKSAGFTNKNGALPSNCYPRNPDQAPRLAFLFPHRITADVSY